MRNPNNKGVDPARVLSPKNRVSNVEVICDYGEYSMAILDWDNKLAIGVRWNGTGIEDIGTPQSRGIPTWFIMPSEIIDPYLRDKIVTGCPNPMANISASVKKRVAKYLGI